MEYIVPVIVLVMIALQGFFFVKNLRRMKEYRQIFEKDESWGISHDSSTGFVVGISGEGNSVFDSIKESINKYLKNNSGSVIDFNLLKDAVDRHCDTVENDINTLTPVPLYCGLAGTMVGVIIGLSSLLYTGSITALLSSGSGDFAAAAGGVNDLLLGVAWAMVASICGIALTTISSILFKRSKLDGESGKNTFLAWLQSRLLPELPSDTSEALNRLVMNLNSFNATFADNTTSLRNALKEVNESYRIQGNIIQAVHDMDVMKMAKANVGVLRELQQCTDKLEVFNQYLDDIHGYTDAIHTFTILFEGEANRLHVLEEIKDYFNRHKAEIARNSANVDVALKDALTSLKESARGNVGELHQTLVKQAEEFKQILADEKENFEKISKEIRAQFSDQLQQMPMLERKLSEISAIPGQLDKLIKKMEESNAKVLSSVSSTMEKTAKEIVANVGRGTVAPTAVSGNGMPVWMRWTIVGSVIVIALACVVNTCYNIFYGNVQTTTTEPMETEVDSTSVTSDTAKVGIVAKDTMPASNKTIGVNPVKEGVHAKDSIPLGK